MWLANNFDFTMIVKNWPLCNEGGIKRGHTSICTIIIMEIIIISELLLDLYFEILKMKIEIIIIIIIIIMIIIIKK